MDKKFIFIAMVVVGVVFVLPLGRHLLLAPQPLEGEVAVAIGSMRIIAEVQNTDAGRARGLSGRDFLPEDRGMVFLFPFAGRFGFWMEDMQFPIDIIWIKGDRVLGFLERALPEQGMPLTELTIHYPPEGLRVDTVLEVNAGVVETYGIQVGDRVVVE